MAITRHRYHYDQAFHLLVDTLIAQICQCRYTPSEMRDAALLASIIYAEKNIGANVIYTREVTNWLEGREK